MPSYKTEGSGVINAIHASGTGAYIVSDNNTVFHRWALNDDEYQSLKGIHFIFSEKKPIDISFDPGLKINVIATIDGEKYLIRLDKRITKYQTLKLQGEQVNDKQGTRNTGSTDCN